MKAFITITQGNGTFSATARIGTGKAQRASCTMGREQAAQRAAAKALGTDEDNIVLTEWSILNKGHFETQTGHGIIEVVLVAAKTDSVFWAEARHPQLVVGGLRETITWHTTGHPDVDTTVLIQDPTNEITGGFWDGEFWRDAGSEAVIGEVKAWADMPGGVP